MQVQFERKGQVAATGDAAMTAAPSPAPQPQQQPKSKNMQPGNVWMSGQRRNNDHSTNESADRMATNTIHLIKNHGIPVVQGASILVGRIRVIFINGIKKSEDQTLNFEVESFKYLDSILFNDLIYLIASTIQYGSRNTVPMGNLLKMITDSASLVDYYLPEKDYNLIKSILVEIYNAF